MLHQRRGVVMKKNIPRFEKTSEMDSLRDDLLIGADAIARELNWLTPSGDLNRRRVYHVAQHGDLPIHHVKGLGVCARRSAIRNFFEKLDQQRLDKLDSESGKR